MEHHLPALILDLTLILGTGALVTLLFRKIKQPLVLGYILAGFLIGPHLRIFPTVAEPENIETLANIGVIFLLFGLGLEFSFKKLMRVGGSASISAMVEIVFIVVAGYFTGKLLGWNNIDCLFLGGMLASSSTTIIIRAFDELNVKSKGYAKVVFGILVVEDIVVILLMVLLSTIAVTKNIEGQELIFTVGKLFFFLILWFISGIYIIPSFLKKIKKSLDDEGFLILSLGLCLIMVAIAVYAGFSAELGAFIMGSILAETTSAERIEHVTKPVKDLFGVIFFVSIGMMIDPVLIGHNIGVVLIITVLVIAGKVFSTGLGALIAGKSLHEAVQIGMSMAQIGEFAFIVATLGLSLGVISDVLFPIAVGVSAITTFTTPYMIKYSDNFSSFLERILPNRWILYLNAYSSSTQTIQAESKWRGYVMRTHTTIVTNGIISIAILVLGTKVLYPFVNGVMPEAAAFIPKVISLILIFVVLSPFLWAILFKNPDDLDIGQLWIHPEYKRGPLLMVTITRLIFAVILISYPIVQLFSYYALAFVPLILLFLYFASQREKDIYKKMESRFLSNFNSRDEEARKKANFIKEEMLPRTMSPAWNINLVDLEIGQCANYAGKSLEKLDWRKCYGINVVYIKRGERLIYAPKKDMQLFPFDHIGITATDEELEKFLPIFKESDESPQKQCGVEDIVLKKVIATVENGLTGKVLRTSGITERTGGMVIGVERGNEHFLNPASEMIFKENDILWIVGERDKLGLLYRENH